MNPMTYYIAFKSILAKEVSRFTRIWIQTLVPPAITMSLYFVIFGNLIGSRIGDMGRFRAPSLRNLRFTAPYMHDGSLATLAEVLDAYAAGGHARQLHGEPSPLQSDLVRGFTLTTDERRQLEAFLDALNDEAFVTE